MLADWYLVDNPAYITFGIIKMSSLISQSWRVNTITLSMDKDMFKMILLRFSLLRCFHSALHLSLYVLFGQGLIPFEIITVQNHSQVS